jgi:hypothetical protein
MENESVKKSFNQTRTGLQESAIAHTSKFYKKHLLNSVNESLGKRDLESLASLHRYFDYNLNFIDTQGSKPVHPVKVHQPELNLSGMQLRIGHID